MKAPVTVGELIKRLNSYPPDQIVYANVDEVVVVEDEGGKEHYIDTIPLPRPIHLKPK